MNGKEQIAAVLAHEVKNPVSLIKMNVQYIKDFCPKALENNFSVIEKELEKIPKEKVRAVAAQNIADISNSNRRDFRF